MELLNLAPQEPGLVRILFFLMKRSRGACGLVNQTMHASRPQVLRSSILDRTARSKLFEYRVGDDPFNVQEMG